MKATSDDVPTLSRRSTSLLSNGDVPDLKRKSSSISRSDSDASPQLKRQKSSVKSVNNVSATSLRRSTSSASSKVSKSVSLVKKASSVKLSAKRIRKPKRIFTIEDIPTRKRKSGGKSEEKALLYRNKEYLALKTEDGKCINFYFFKSN